MASVFKAFEAEHVEEVCSLFLKANEKTRCEFNA